MDGFGFHMFNKSHQSNPAASQEDLSFPFHRISCISHGSGLLAMASPVALQICKYAKRQTMRAKGRIYAGQRAAALHPLASLPLYPLKESLRSVLGIVIGRVTDVRITAGSEVSPDAACPGEQHPVRNRMVGGKFYHFGAGYPRQSPAGDDAQFCNQLTISEMLFRQY